MELGLSMASLLDREWSEALDVCAMLGLTVIEPCSGGHVPKRHYDPARLLHDVDRRAAFLEAVASRGLRIVSMGVYGNPLAPDATARDAARRDYADTIELAHELGVNRVSCIVGCPGGGPRDESPNWIVNMAFPGMFREAYRWQWEECAIPYWRDLTAQARERDVLVCVEPIAGDLVYNLETYRRLKDAVGDPLRLHFDPSHLWWQGIDPIAMVLEAGSEIGFAHAKDVKFDPSIVSRNGLVSACEYDAWDKRPWSMRAIGYGHDSVFWRDYVTALRRVGYDDALVIELQEPYMKTLDALRMSVKNLSAVLPQEPPPAGNWFDAYAWTPPDEDT